MRKNLFYALGIGCLLFGYVYGQQTISGTVSSASDATPLEGVAVVAKGTTVGAFTDVNGSYTLSLPSEVQTITFSFIGYKLLEVDVNGRTEINVDLVEGDLDLDEVIITGFGSQTKRNITGNIAKVSGQEIENVPVTSFESAIQGRAAGVFVSKQNGKLGNGINIRIRGSASVTGSNEPLYVIDGIVVTSQDQSTINGTATTNPLSDLNFNDIESIDILKDASAAAIYGSRASNGVVIITTKRGNIGKTKFNVSYSGGVSEPSNKRDWLNGTQYLQLWDEAFSNVAEADGTLFGLTGEEWKDRRIPGWRDGNDTDWQDLAFNDDAGFQQLDVNVSGGNEKTRFYISASALDQSGILIYNDFERFSGRINLDHNATKDLKIGMNLSLARTTNDRVPNDNSFSTPLQLVALPPAQPLNDPDNPDELFQQTVYFNGKLYEDNSLQQQRVYRTLGNVYLDWEFIQGLSFRTEFGVDILSQNEEVYFNSLLARNTNEPNGFGENAFRHLQNYSTNNYFTYNTLINEDHSLNVVAGMSYQETDNRFAQLEGRNFPNDTFRKLASAAEISEGTSTGTGFSIVSYFA
ncbi:MAG: SusC/RagA family TonB-linked outer membrane protein, partial [Bacteroidota bacterium]